jgi:Fe-S-cluster containining protein
MENFFTFPDRALKYDCPSCGSHCCKGSGLALEASAEVVAFARLEPRLASLLHPMNKRFAQVTDVTDGCWFLQHDGRCSVELEHGYAAKPHTCRLFPFNRIFPVGGVRLVDFNSKICPLQDASDARDGQSWDDLARQIEAEPLAGRGSAQQPEGGAQLGWLSHEASIRDAIDEHLHEPDYAAFAALQDEAADALLNGQAAPRRGEDRVLARAWSMRQLLGRWRAHHGVSDDPGLAAAARKAARQVALLTCSWRFLTVLASGATPYASELMLLPRRLLAAAHLLELSHLGRRKEPGLRAATELWREASPIFGLLAFWTHRAKLQAPLKIVCANEAQPALNALGAMLTAGEMTLGEAIEGALSPYPRELRALALSALAFGDVELMIE